MIENWWNEVDKTILECLRRAGPLSPAELGRRLGMSEREATAFLSTLIREGKVRMPLVELDEAAWRSRETSRAYTRH